MGVEFAAAGYGDARERRALAQSVRHGSRSDWRLYRHGHGQAAIAARSNADFAGRLVGRGGRLLGAATVAEHGLRLIDGFGRRPCGRESGYQACEPNRISGGQRNQALPQRPLGECYPHHPVSDPATLDNNILGIKKFLCQRESLGRHY
jgi:hypothetical protein